ncbi:hypothetical protein ABPG75_011267 [Micractinium tetrahymenae]
MHRLLAVSPLAVAAGIAIIFFIVYLLRISAAPPLEHASSGVDVEKGLLLPKASAPAGGLGVTSPRGAPAAKGTWDKWLEQLGALLRVYGLDISVVGPLLAETGGILAGGATVAALMGEPADSYHGDLDFFIAPDATARFLQALTDADPYKRLSAYRAGLGGGGVRANIIDIVDMEHSASKRKVQLIISAQPSTAFTSFDRQADRPTPCCTWYDGRQLSMAFPQHTLAGEMFYLHSEGDPRTTARMRKYEASARGFRLVDTPPGAAARMAKLRSAKPTASKAVAA